VKGLENCVKLTVKKPKELSWN